MLTLWLTLLSNTCRCHTRSLLMVVVVVLLKSSVVWDQQRWRKACEDGRYWLEEWKQRCFEKMKTKGFGCEFYYCSRLMLSKWRDVVVFSGFLFLGVSIISAVEAIVVNPGENVMFWWMFFGVVAVQWLRSTQESNFQLWVFTKRREQKENQSNKTSHL